MGASQEGCVDWCQRQNTLPPKGIVVPVSPLSAPATWLLLPLPLCFPGSHSKRIVLPCICRFPQDHQEICMGFKVWDICAPESKRWLFAGQNQRQSRWLGGWVEIQIHSEILPCRWPFPSVVPETAFFICICPLSFVFVGHLWMTPKLVFNPPRVYGESLIPFRFNSLTSGTQLSLRNSSVRKISVWKPSVWMASVWSCLKKGG